MFEINPNLNTEELQKDFKKNGSVQIFDFLTQESAETIYNFLSSGMPEDWWYTSVRHSGNRGYSKSAPAFRRSPENFQKIEDSERVANESFAASSSINSDRAGGGFCYSFDRTLGDHSKDCSCKECRFREFLSSEETVNFLSFITGMNIEEAGEIFASRYRSGQFLAPHCDQAKGKIGFVYNITRDWKPQYGGALHFMSDDWNTVTKVVFPTFNRVTIFDIVTRNGVPHFVSHVAPGITKKRISFAGWFKGANQKYLK